MKPNIVIQTMDVGGDRFMVAIHEVGVSAPFFECETVGAADCALTLLRLAELIKVMGYECQVWVCERLVEKARQVVVSMN